MYPVDNTAATSATLPNLQCSTEYTVWVHVRGSRINITSTPTEVYLPERGMYKSCKLAYSLLYLYCRTTPAPPTATNITAQEMNASSVKLAWQWTISGPAPNCFNTTTVTYHPEGGSESSLQLSDPAATETTLTDLQCNTNYSITVVATAGEHRRESEAITVYLPLQGIPR